MVDQKQAFKTARTRVITFPMVDFPSSWPKADSGKCSIFEAIVQVGRAKYGPAWTNTELCAFYWTDQPEEAEARRGAMSKLPVRKPPPPESLASHIRAAEAFASEGRQVRIMRPYPAFKDWNDQLRGIAR